VTTELLMAGADNNTSKFFINCLGKTCPVVHVLSVCDV
jgi:hypothetical protein